VHLRDAGIDAPILLLSEPGPDGMAEAVARRLVPTAYTAGGWSRWRGGGLAGRVAGPGALKVDTGMHRVGADPGALSDLADRVAADPGLVLGAVWTIWPSPRGPRRSTASSPRCSWSGSTARSRNWPDRVTGHP